MNNDNEPPSLMLFSRKTDEKLVFNKCWPKLEILDEVQAFASFPHQPLRFNVVFSLLEWTQGGLICPS